MNYVFLIDRFVVNLMVVSSIKILTKIKESMNLGNLLLWSLFRFIRFLFFGIGVFIQKVKKHVHKFQKYQL